MKIWLVQKRKSFSVGSVRNLEAAFERKAKLLKIKHKSRTEQK